VGRAETLPPTEPDHGEERLKAAEAPRAVGDQPNGRVIASELDVDGAGKTYALWGEGPIYAGPGTVWYARER
jgi:hypothetical protein